MSTDLIIGQTWRDKDKRRPKEGTLVEFTPEVVTIDFGKGITKEYDRARFEKRWEHVEPEDAPEIYTTREEWLSKAIELITLVVFNNVDVDVPTTRVSVGWPGGRGPKAKTIGQCFATKTTGDKVAQIFISPVLEEPMIVLATLVHEIVHAVDDCESGHKKGFIEIARKVGLTSKWTATVAGDELAELLKGIASQLGKYPHSAINLSDRPVVQKTYMLKVGCIYDEDYFVRMTKGKLEDFGAPICPCHNEPMEEV